MSLIRGEVPDWFNTLGYSSGFDLHGTGDSKSYDYGGRDGGGYGDGNGSAYGRSYGSSDGEGAQDSKDVKKIESLLLLAWQVEL